VGAGQSPLQLASGQLQSSTNQPGQQGQQQHPQQQGQQQASQAGGAPGQYAHHHQHHTSKHGPGKPRHHHMEEASVLVAWLQKRASGYVRIAMTGGPDDAVWGDVMTSEPQLMGAVGLVIRLPSWTPDTMTTALFRALTSDITKPSKVIPLTFARVTQGIAIKSVGVVPKQVIPGVPSPNKYCEAMARAHQAAVLYFATTDLKQSKDGFPATADAYIAGTMPAPTMRNVFEVSDVFGALWRIQLERRAVLASRTKIACMRLKETAMVCEQVEAELAAAAPALAAQEAKVVAATEQLDRDQQAEAALGDTVKAQVGLLFEYCLL
jgi:hypothetical protein